MIGVRGAHFFLRQRKSHRNGGFCVSSPLAGGGSISSLAKTKRWYATNLRGVPEMAQRFSLGTPYQHLNSNSINYVLLSAHWSPGFWDTNERTADLHCADPVYARMALVEMTRCGVSPAKGSGGDGGRVTISTARVRDVGEYRLTSPFRGRPC